MPPYRARLGFLLVATVLGCVLDFTAAAAPPSPDAEECPSSSSDTALLQVSRRAAWGPNSKHPLSWLGREKKAAPEGDGRQTFRDKAAVVAEASLATDLQDLFEVLPGADEFGYMGADSDTSLVIRGGPTGHRVLWIFADTFITKYDAANSKRVELAHKLARSSVGIQELHKGTHKDGKGIGPPTFYWTSPSNGSPGFFNPSFEHHNAGETLVPVAGIACRSGTSVFLLGLRMQAQNIVGVSGIAIPDVVSERDPTNWKYTTFDIPSDSALWLSSIFFADDEGDVVYLLGHQTGLQLADDPATFLARTRLSKLMQGKWEGVEYWSAPGRWTSTLEPENLKPIELPTWENTVTWSKELHLWYSFHIPSLSAEVNLWTAKEITGNWSVTKVYDIPAPFNDAPWINYAAKSHPALARHWGYHHSRPALLEEGTEGLGEAELVFTYVSNVLSFDANVVQEAFFGDGSFDLPKRGYWPRFVRVHARRAGHDLTASN